MPTPKSASDILATLLQLQEIDELKEGTTVIIVNADGSPCAIIGPPDIVVPTLMDIAAENQTPEKPKVPPD